MKLQILKDKKVFEKVYEDMKTQFPPEELKSFDAIYENLSSENYQMAVICENGEIVGYVLYYAGEFLWIDYLAIRKEHQSHGYGSKILKELFELYKDVKGCYFEVEKISDDMNTVKRMRFYERLGCKNTGIKYYFPNDVKELEMELLFKSFVNKLPSIKEILTDVKTVFGFLHKGVINLNDTIEKIEDCNK